MHSREPSNPGYALDVRSAVDVSRQAVRNQASGHDSAILKQHSPSSEAGQQDHTLLTPKRVAWFADWARNFREKFAAAAGRPRKRAQLLQLGRPLAQQELEHLQEHIAITRPAIAHREAWVVFQVQQFCPASIAALLLKQEPSQRGLRAERISAVAWNEILRHFEAAVGSTGLTEASDRLENMETAFREIMQLTSALNRFTAIHGSLQGIWDSARQCTHASSSRSPVAAKSLQSASTKDHTAINVRSNATAEALLQQEADETAASQLKKQNALKKRQSIKQSKASCAGATCLTSSSNSLLGNLTYAL